MGTTNTVWQFEGDTTQAYSNFVWKSKKFLLPATVPFTCARVRADFDTDMTDYFAAVANYNAIVARNKARLASGNVGGRIGEDAVGALAVNGDYLEDIPAVASPGEGAYLLIKVYMNGELKQTKSVYSSEPFKLKSGYRGRSVEVQLEGNIPVHSFEMAQSIEELMGA